MQLTNFATVLFAFAATTASALPLDERTNDSGFKNCPAKSQYTCTSAGGLVNALNCVNALNDNIVKIPIDVGLKERSPHSDEGEGAKYCCKSVGLGINLLNCVNLLNGNSVKVPISISLGL